MRKETCARCGHQSGGCPRCGREDLFLGSSINEQNYCHTFCEEEPTCYMLAQWEGATAITELLDLDR